MKISVTGRHVEVTPDIRQTIDQKLSKLDRLLNDNAVSAQIVLSRGHHHQCVAEVVLHARGDHILHGEDEAPQWTQAIGGAVDKVNQQAHTLKGKWGKPTPSLWTLVLADDAGST